MLKKIGGFKIRDEKSTGETAQNTNSTLKNIRCKTIGSLEHLLEAEINPEKGET